MLSSNMQIHNPTKCKICCFYMERILTETKGDNKYLILLLKNKDRSIN